MNFALIILLILRSFNLELIFLDLHKIFFLFGVIKDKIYLSKQSKMIEASQSSNNHCNLKLFYNILIFVQFKLMKLIKSKYLILNKFYFKHFNFFYPKIFGSTNQFKFFSFIKFFPTNPI